MVRVLTSLTRKKNTQETYLLRAVSSFTYINLGCLSHLYAWRHGHVTSSRESPPYISVLSSGAALYISVPSGAPPYISSPSHRTRGGGLAAATWVPGFPCVFSGEGRHLWSVQPISFSIQENCLFVHWEKPIGYPSPLHWTHGERVLCGGDRHLFVACCF